MGSSPHILVVAQLTASTPELISEVRRHADAGAEFTVLVPDAADARGPEWSAGEALALLDRIAPGRVRALDRGPDVLRAIRRSVEEGWVDRVIVAAAPEHLRRWMRRDAGPRLKGLGVPVSIVKPA